jgi:Uma2 family endonuclease
VSFYTDARWPRSEVGRTLPPVPPDLVVEVASPGNRPGELLRKVGEYQSAGVPLVWVVYPQRRSVAVYRPREDEPAIFREGDILENFPELPGFRCPVSDLFV